MSTPNATPRHCPICGNDVVLEAKSGAAQGVGAPRYYCAGTLGCGLTFGGAAAPPGGASAGAEAA